VQADIYIYIYIFLPILFIILNAGWLKYFYKSLICENGMYDMKMKLAGWYETLPTVYIPRLGNKHTNFTATYLSRETFHQDGDEEVEQNVIAKRHKCHEVQRRPVACLLHSVKQHDVPVFLSKDLSGERSEAPVELLYLLQSCRTHTSNVRHNWVGTVMSSTIWQLNIGLDN